MPEKNSFPLPAVMTTDEVAAALRVTKLTAQIMCKRGELPGAFKIGDGPTGHWRVPTSTVAALLRGPATE